MTHVYVADAYLIDPTETTVRRTYIAAKKEIMIEHISADGTVVGIGWVGVHYQSPLYDLTADTVL